MTNGDTKRLWIRIFGFQDSIVAESLFRAGLISSILTFPLFVHAIALVCYKALTPLSTGSSNTAIKTKGAVFDTIVGFIDGKVFQICRPSKPPASLAFLGDAYQQMFYNGLAFIWVIHTSKCFMTVIKGIIR